MRSKHKAGRHEACNSNGRSIKHTGECRGIYVIRRSANRGNVYVSASERRARRDMLMQSISANQEKLDQRNNKTMAAAVGQGFLSRMYDAARNLLSPRSVKSLG